MTNRFAPALGAWFFSVSAWAAPATFAGRDIEKIHSGDFRPCGFFTLVGVDLADPLVPNSPWFSIPHAHPNYKSVMAMMMLAKATGKKVYVVTTGNVAPACGHAEVNSFIIE